MVFGKRRLVTTGLYGRLVKLKFFFWNIDMFSGCHRSIGYTSTSFYRSPGSQSLLINGNRVEECTNKYVYCNNIIKKLSIYDYIYKRIIIRYGKYNSSATSPTYSFFFFCRRGYFKLFVSLRVKTFGV